MPEATTKVIMGHMSRAILERYSHIRLAARVDAMNAVETRSAFSVTIAKFPLKSTEELLSDHP